MIYLFTFWLYSKFQVVQTPDEHQPGVDAQFHVRRNHQTGPQKHSLAGNDSLHCCFLTVNFWVCRVNLATSTPGPGLSKLDLVSAQELSELPDWLRFFLFQVLPRRERQE